MNIYGKYGMHINWVEMEVEGIVMILIMREVEGGRGRVVGEGVIEKVWVENGMWVHTDVQGHVDMMTVLGQGLQEAVVVMVEVIVRTAMMMTGTDMTGQIEEETAMIIVTMNIIQR